MITKKVASFMPLSMLTTTTRSYNYLLISFNSFTIIACSNILEYKTVYLTHLYFHILLYTHLLDLIYNKTSMVSTGSTW